MDRAEQALRRAQAKFDRLLDRRAAPAAQRAFEAAQTDVIRAVHRAAALEAPTHVLAAIVRQGQAATADAIARSISESSLEAHREGLRSYGEYISAMDGAPTLLDDPEEIEAAAKARVSSIKKRIEEAALVLATAMATKITHQLEVETVSKVTAWGAHHAGRDEEAPPPVHVPVGHPAGILLPAEASGIVETVAGDSAWMVDRTSITETAYAYNSSQVEAGKLLRPSIPDLFNRWVEHVSDATWEPTDKKTAHDSIYLHAQVAEPGGMFSMPDDDPTGQFQGDEWEGPPNRPHDRAVLTPWRAAWNVPAWLNVGGRRVWLVRGKGPSRSTRRK